MTALLHLHSMIWWEWYHTLATWMAVTTTRIVKTNKKDGSASMTSKYLIWRQDSSDLREKAASSHTFSFTRAKTTVDNSLFLN